MTACIPTVRKCGAYFIVGDVDESGDKTDQSAHSIHSACSIYMYCGSLPLDEQPHKALRNLACQPGKLPTSPAAQHSNGQCKPAI